jgi:hypothetical protein
MSARRSGTCDHRRWLCFAPQRSVRNTATTLRRTRATGLSQPSAQAFTKAAFEALDGELDIHVNILRAALHPTPFAMLEP